MAGPSKIVFESDAWRKEYDYREFVRKLAECLSVDEKIVLGTMVFVAARMQDEKIEKAAREINHGG